jgi:2-dehydro-3-deoxyphosphogluconate aldolase/(4S)-4-hydroxy-2-oxoglutarate aldolase
VKFFPAMTSGGLDAVKALSAPFGGLRFVPTGGVTLDTARSWIDFPAVLAVGGSWVAPRNLLDEGRFDEIEDIVRRTVAVLGDGEDRAS